MRERERDERGEETDRQTASARTREKKHERKCETDTETRLSELQEKKQHVCECVQRGWASVERGHKKVNVLHAKFQTRMAAPSPTLTRPSCFTRDV